MRFAEWLIREHLTQTEAAHRLGVSQGHISDLVNDRFWPSRDMFKRLWQVTNGEVTPNDFLFGDEVR